MSTSTNNNADFEVQAVVEESEGLAADLACEMTSFENKLRAIRERKIAVEVQSEKTKGALLETQRQLTEEFDEIAPRLYTDTKNQFFSNDDLWERVTEVRESLKKIKQQLEQLGNSTHDLLLGDKELASILFPSLKSELHLANKDTFGTTQDQSNVGLNKATQPCLTCAVHRNKCDLSLPTCGTCERAGRSCQGYDLQTVDDGIIISSKPSSNEALAKSNDKSLKNTASLQTATSGIEGQGEIHPIDTHNNKLPDPGKQRKKAASDTQSTASRPVTPAQRAVIEANAGSEDPARLFLGVHSNGSSKSSGYAPFTDNNGSNVPTPSTSRSGRRLVKKKGEDGPRGYLVGMDALNALGNEEEEDESVGAGKKRRKKADPREDEWQPSWN